MELAANWCDRYIERVSTTLPAFRYFHCESIFSPQKPFHVPPCVSIGDGPKSQAPLGNASLNIEREMGAQPPQRSNRRLPPSRPPPDRPGPAPPALALEAAGALRTSRATHTPPPPRPVRWRPRTRPERQEAGAAVISPNLKPPGCFDTSSWPLQIALGHGATRGAGEATARHGPRTRQASYVPAAWGGGGGGAPGGRRGRRIDRSNLCRLPRAAK